LSETKPIWIARDFSRCSGCRRCEIACSIHHEKKIWPDASRVRIYMLVPGAEIPHLCTQCENPPCIDSCPVSALSISEKTGAILVDNDKCTSCRNCIEACEGRIPFLHPESGKAVICDLCDGDPQCVKVCQEGRWGALWTTSEKPMGNEDFNKKLYARKPEEMVKDFVTLLYGEKGEEFV
jgi:Fe-S-cluster-containing dehydrogenase component